jgi:hypothetical protein
VGYISSGHSVVRHDLYLLQLGYLVGELIKSASQLIVYYSFSRVCVTVNCWTVTVLCWCDWDRSPSVLFVRLDWDRSPSVSKVLFVRLDWDRSPSVSIGCEAL